MLSVNAVAGLGILWAHFLNARFDFSRAVLESTTVPSTLQSRCGPQNCWCRLLSSLLSIRLGAATLGVWARLRAYLGLETRLPCHW